MLTQEDKINVILMKKIMTEKKTILPFLRNEDLKKCKVETEKVNKLLPNVSTGHNTVLNEIIFAGVKLVYDKIVVPLRNPNRNAKSGWEIRLKWLVKNCNNKRKY